MKEKTMTEKYEIVRLQTKLGVQYRQIKALIDIPRYNVKVGDMGGLVSGGYNLSHEGDCWIEKGSSVFDQARVEGNAIVRNNSAVYDQSCISGNAVIENSCVWRNSVVTDNAIVRKCFVDDSSVVRDNSHIENMTLEEACVLTGSTRLIIAGQDGLRVRNLQGQTEKDLFIQGPALSSGNYSAAYKQSNGEVVVTTGCFHGTLDEYLAAIEETHKDDLEYLHQYREFHANFVKHFSQ